MSLELIVERTEAKPGFNRPGLVQIHTSDGRPVNIKEFFVDLIGFYDFDVEDESSSVNGNNIVIFFKQRQDISHSDDDLEDGRYRSFQWWFPDQLEAAARFTPESERWLELPQRQDLPPSGDLGGGSSIKYKYEAVLIDKDKDRRYTGCRELSLSITRINHRTDPAMVDMVRRMTYNLCADSTSEGSLSVALKLPTEAVLAEPLPIWVRLLHKTEQTPPQVEIQSFSFNLVAHTSIRVDDLKIRKQWTHRYVILDKHFQDSDLPVISTEAKDLQTLLGTALIPRCPLPTFSSSNVRLTYSLHASFTLQTRVHDSEAYYTLRRLQFVLDSINILPAESSESAWKKELKFNYDNSPERRFEHILR